MPRQLAHAAMPRSCCDNTPRNGTQIAYRNPRPAPRQVIADPAAARPAQNQHKVMQGQREARPSPAGTGAACLHNTPKERHTNRISQPGLRSSACCCRPGRSQVRSRPAQGRCEFSTSRAGETATCRHNVPTRARPRAYRSRAYAPRRVLADLSEAESAQDPRVVSTRPGRD